MNHCAWRNKFILRPEKQWTTATNQYISHNNITLQSHFIIKDLNKYPRIEFSGGEEVVRTDRSRSHEDSIPTISHKEV